MESEARVNEEYLNCTCKKHLEQFINIHDQSLSIAVCWSLVYRTNYRCLPVNRVVSLYIPGGDTLNLLERMSLSLR